mmetsp:Transcript_35366/g.88911  ORF Transcript_35366/g.88911 Transcript_35366/m.88911 type:complete len:292 (-) Transcript_35366:330-1205(-)
MTTFSAATWPAHAAKCSGVFPSVSLALERPGHTCRIARRTSTSPREAARCATDVPHSAELNEVAASGSLGLVLSPPRRHISCSSSSPPPSRPLSRSSSSSAHSRKPPRSARYRAERCSVSSTCTGAGWASNTFTDSQLPCAAAPWSGVQPLVSWERRACVDPASSASNTVLWFRVAARWMGVRWHSLGLRHEGSPLRPSSAFTGPMQPLYTAWYSSSFSMRCVSWSRRFSSSEDASSSSSSRSSAMTVCFLALVLLTGRAMAEKDEPPSLESERIADTQSSISSWVSAHTR